MDQPKKSEDSKRGGDEIPACPDFCLVDPFGLSLWEDAKADLSTRAEPRDPPPEPPMIPPEPRDLLLEPRDLPPELRDLPPEPLMIPPEPRDLLLEPPVIPLEPRDLPRELPVIPPEPRPILAEISTQSAQKQSFTEMTIESTLPKPAFPTQNLIKPWLRAWRMIAWN